MSFPTTQWTRLGAASLHGDTHSRGLLDGLCRDYQEPVRAFLRMRGYAEHEVDDFTQEFFAQFLASRAWKRADRAQGRFRTFVLGILMHVIGHETAKAHTGKRGGGEIAASLEELAENGFEPPGESPATLAFDREWALSLMNAALDTVEKSFVDQGQAAQWQVLCDFLPGGSAPPTYEDAAARLGMSLPAVTTAVHRLRQSFRDVLRRAVARTVEAPHEVEAELAHLRDVLSAKDS